MGLRSQEPSSDDTKGEVFAEKKFRRILKNILEDRSPFPHIHGLAELKFQNGCGLQKKKQILVKIAIFTNIEKKSNLEAKRL
jgi:altronate dehydratase